MATQSQKAEQNKVLLESLQNNKGEATMSEQTIIEVQKELEPTTEHPLMALDLSTVTPNEAQQHINKYTILDLMTTNPAAAKVWAQLLPLSQKAHLNDLPSMPTPVFEDTMHENLSIEINDDDEAIITMVYDRDEVIDKLIKYQGLLWDFRAIDTGDIEATFDDAMVIFEQEHNSIVALAGKNKANREALSVIADKTVQPSIDTETIKRDNAIRARTEQARMACTPRVLFNLLFAARGTTGSASTRSSNKHGLTLMSAANSGKMSLTDVPGQWYFRNHIVTITSGDTWSISNLSGQQLVTQDSIPNKKVLDDKKKSFLAEVIAYINKAPASANPLQHYIDAKANSEKINVNGRISLRRIMD